MQRVTYNRNNLSQERIKLLEDIRFEWSPEAGRTELWLESFNEWMTRCGMEFAGHPFRRQLPFERTSAVASSLLEKSIKAPARDISKQIDSTSIN